MISFFATHGENIPLPRNVLPLVLAPNQHADWYFPIVGERDFLATRDVGNPDHLRA